MKRNVLIAAGYGVALLLTSGAGLAYAGAISVPTPTIEGFPDGTSGETDSSANTYATPTVTEAPEAGTSAPAATEEATAQDAPVSPTAGATIPTSPTADSGEGGAGAPAASQGAQDANVQVAETAASAFTPGPAAVEADPEADPALDPDQIAREAASQEQMDREAEIIDYTSRPSAGDGTVSESEPTG